MDVLILKELVGDPNANSIIINIADESLLPMSGDEEFILFDDNLDIILEEQGIEFTTYPKDRACTELELTQYDTTYSIDVIDHQDCGTAMVDFRTITEV